MPGERRLRFVGRSQEDLRDFPGSARQEAGRQLGQLQWGREPNHWKPMRSIGSGVAEIRIHDQAGAFRVIYIAKFEDTVYVLHCFEKKSQKTGRGDLKIAEERYRDVLAERARRH